MGTVVISPSNRMFICYHGNDTRYNNVKLNYVLFIKMQLCSIKIFPSEQSVQKILSLNGSKADRAEAGWRWRGWKGNIKPALRYGAHNIYWNYNDDCQKSS